MLLLLELKDVLGPLSVACSSGNQRGLCREVVAPPSKTLLLLASLGITMAATGMAAPPIS